MRAFYNRRGNTTELWIPKTISSFISWRARGTNSNTEAFSLGLLACFAEFPLSFALVVIAANSILELNIVERNIALVGYILITILPLVIARFCIRRGKTVVDIQRWREKNKTFLRIISGILFLVLGTFLIAYRLIGIPL
jgi:cytochrome c biogenesis protein CcdA